MQPAACSKGSGTPATPYAMATYQTQETLKYAEPLHLRVPPLVLPMELPPTATITEAPLLLPCPAAGRAGDCPIHMPAVVMRQLVNSQVRSRATEQAS